MKKKPWWILGLIGIAQCLARRDYLLPIWMVIPFFVEGRSAPGPAAIPLAMLGGILAGALAGFIPGFLKAFTGAHEVVTTIMLNAMIQLVISGLVNDVFRAPGFRKRAR